MSDKILKNIFSQVWYGSHNHRTFILASLVYKNPPDLQN